MRALVTGGAGFIGSHVVDLLLEDDHHVAVLDDLSSGRKENLGGRAVLHEMDVRSENLPKVFAKEKPEVVFHYAAQVNVRDSIDNPKKDADINVLGALNLLECARKHDVEKIIYASSGGAVYGEPRYLPVDEKHPTDPISPYGVSKLAVEKYLYMYEKNYGIDCVSLRYGNVYGPRCDPEGEGRVIPIFINRMLEGVPPKINGDGKQTRDFVYVNDVARVNLVLAARKTKSRVFNIGSGVESSVNKITDELKKIMGSDVKPVYGPPIAGEVERIFLDVSRAKKELGWKPEVSLYEGLEKTVEWFKSK